MNCEFFRIVKSINIVSLKTYDDYYEKTPWKFIKDSKGDEGGRGRYIRLIKNVLRNTIHEGLYVSMIF